jgi:hypothetical protein
MCYIFTENHVQWNRGDFMTEEMPIPYIETQILCQQCTAVLPVEQGALIAVCEFCGASNAVDKSEVVLHFAARDTLRENDAASALRRWMGGNDTVKNLDKKASIERSQFQMWPMWQIRATLQGEEKVFLKPAAAISVLDVAQMSIPASDLEPFDYEMSADALDPTVPLNAVKKWLAEDQQVAAGAIHETSLVHLPVYIFNYSFGGRGYTAVVDAATGKVFADRFPSKLEVPYQTIGGIGCALYFIAALFPAIGFMLGGITGLGGAIILYLIVGAIMSVPIFIIAAIISAKI